MNLEAQFLLAAGSALVSAAFSAGAVLVSLRATSRELSAKMDSIAQLLNKDIHDLDRRLTAIESLVIYREIKRHDNNE